MPTPSEIRATDPAVTPLSGTEVLHAEQGTGGSVGVTVDELADYARTTIMPPIGLFFGGVTVDGEKLWRMVSTQNFTIPAGLAGSDGRADVASTGTAIFELVKNGSTFGTVTFTASTTGTLAAASPTSFTVGDVLEVVAPATADATLADISITIKRDLT